MRSELTRSILMPLFSNFLRNLTIHFCMVFIFGRVAVSLLCRLQSLSKIHVPIYPYLISEGRQNCSTLYRHSNETATLRKRVPNINTWKWMIKFLRKFKNHGIKIVRVNLIRITKSINLRSILRCWGSVVDIFKLTARAYSPIIEKSVNRLKDNVNLLYSNVQGDIIVK